MSEKYYKPAVPKIDPLLVRSDESKLDPALRSVLGDDGLIKMKLDDEVVLNKIAKDIYKNPMSGFRELYANAVTACLNAREVFGANPYINIMLDPDNRRLVVEEIDSTGLSGDAFKSIYIVLGRSGNFEGTKLGQFGFGRLAWVALSDTMILETKYRVKGGQTGAYAVEGKEGRAFAPLPTPKRKTFGTTVSLVLYESIDITRLEDYIKEVADLSSVATYLTIKGGLEKDYKLNRSPFEYMKLRLGSRTYGRKLTLSNDIVLKGDGFELDALIAQYEENNGSTVVIHDSDYSNLLGLPIYARVETPFSASVLNILDERKFQPTADRERLKDEAVNELTAQVGPLILQYFRQYQAKTYDDFTKLPPLSQAILLHSEALRVGQTSILSVLDQDTQDTIGLLHDFVPVLASLEDYYANPHSLLTVLESYKPGEIFIGDDQRKRKTLRLLKQYNKKAVLVLTHNVTDRALSFLYQRGAREATTFIKAQKLKLKPVPRSQAGYVVHKSGKNAYRILDTRVTLKKDLISKDVVKLTRGAVAKYAKVFDELPTKRTLMADAPDLGNTGITVDDFVKSVADTKVVTSKGELKVSDLLGYKNILFGISDYPEAAQEIYGRSKKLVVLSTADRLFELAVYLIHNGHKYEVNLVAEDEFQKIVGKSVDEATGVDWYKGGKDFTGKLIWSLLHVYSVAGDKKAAELLMAGLRQHDEDKELAELLPTALRLAKVNTTESEKNGK